MINQDFEQLYASLNQGQQAAVDAMEGPVMVIAGPGTGKTQILAVRILNILRTTDTSPHEILCLTYTDAGTAAMRQRLSRFMGADAYKVNIHTFHSLCNKIIQENPEKFARGDLRVMDDLDKLELMDQLIRKIPAGSPIRNYQEDPTFLRRQLDTLFRMMQDEDLTPEYMARGAEKLSQEAAFLDAFPDMVYKRDGKWGRAGDLKRREFEELASNWDKLKHAAALYPEYAKLKKENGVYEFSDMIHWVVDAFKNEPDLLANYQEKFQYVLVDEYQDTSGVQNHILYQLIQFWEDNPNCFVVGDDDQSIYAFQGARVSNMTGFAKKYAGALTTVVLTENYRSTQPILDAAGTLISNNSQRLVNTLQGLSKELSAAGTNRQYPQLTPEFRSYRNRFHEAAGLAESIRSLHNSGTEWQEIAVIYAKHSVAEELTEMLRREDIPFTLARSADILKEPLTEQLLTWLEYLAMEMEQPHKGEYLLYELLHYPLYDISPYEVARISSEIASRKAENLRWRDFLAEYVRKPHQPGLFTESNREALRKLWQHVEFWLKEAASMNVPQLVQAVISDAGFLTLAMNSPEREWSLELLHTLLNHAVSANRKNPFLSLNEYLDSVKKMRRNNISIPLERRIGSKQGVVLTTAHSSKGLEYDHVFLMGAEQDTWEKDRSNSLPFKLKKLFEGLNHNPQSEQSDEENAEERRRLFYVAMTRARKSLTITWANRKIDAKSSDMQPSKFLIEVKGGGETPETSIPKEKLLEAEARLLASISPPRLKPEDTLWMKKRLENFKFSPSTLYDILECGLKFYFNRIVRIPSAPNAALGYGLAVHDALKLAVEQGTRKDNPVWPDEQTLLKWFEQAMYRQRGAFTRKTYELKLAQGRELLPEYYRSRLTEWKQQRVVTTEHWLETSIDGVILGGKADKLIFNGNDVTVVDYKTGNPQNAEKAFRPPTEKSLLEGKLPPKYWFQLGLYMILVSNQPGKSWNGSMAVIDALDKDADGQFPLNKRTYSDEDINLLRQYLAEGWRKVENMEFLTGCGRSDCQWCEFARQTGQSHLPEYDVETSAETWV